MARVTVDEVKEIIDTSLTDAQITAFITAANALVSESVTSTAIGTDQKKEIERWVTAHLIASTREQQLIEAKAGSASAKFQGQTGMMFKSTFYGQNALLLDSSNALARLGGKGIQLYAVPQFDD